MSQPLWIHFESTFSVSCLFFPQTMTTELRRAKRSRLTGCYSGCRCPREKPVEMRQQTNWRDADSLPVRARRSRAIPLAFSSGGLLGIIWKRTACTLDCPRGSLRGEEGEKVESAVVTRSLAHRIRNLVLDEHSHLIHQLVTTAWVRDVLLIV